MKNVVSAYASQVNLGEKRTLWEEFEDVVQKVDVSEKLILGGDLNGHVGEKMGENFLYTKSRLMEELEHQTDQKVPEQKEQYAQQQG